jgi:hypothetical protein
VTHSGYFTIDKVEHPASGSAITQPESACEAVRCDCGWASDAVADLRDAKGQLARHQHAVLPDE